MISRSKKSQVIHMPAINISKPEINNCAICIEPATWRTFCCNDYYHTECLAQWTKRRGKRVCPSCRCDYMKDRKWYLNIDWYMWSICFTTIFIIYSLY